MRMDDQIRLRHGLDVVRSRVMAGQPCRSGRRKRQMTQLFQQHYGRRGSVVTVICYPQRRLSIIFPKK